MDKKSPKYIFITGGVVSSLGKGVAAASLGALLQSRGYTVHSRKFDPYLNITAEMSPLQHGEVYVTEDGHETDLDLGYYERFLGIKLNRNDSVSGGRIYWEVLNAQLNGEYAGKTIQTIPHITDKIKEHFRAPTDTPVDFILCEIGGTVGDIEGQVFLESARQFANDIGRRNVMFVHLTLAPYLEKSGELKTKPTQMSVRRLLESGIQADMLIVRSPRMLDDDERAKTGLFCNLPPAAIITGVDVDNIYQIPLEYEAQGVFTVMAEHFMLPHDAGDLSKFKRIEQYLSADLPTVEIAMVGNYFETPDAYKSLNDALFHAGIQNNVRVRIKKITPPLGGVGIFDAGGGQVGGIIATADSNPTAAAEYARKNNIPYLQLSLITPPLGGVGACEAQAGGGQKIGSAEITIAPGTLAHKIYGKTKIRERHQNQTGRISELPDHPFFIAVDFHPEFNSSPYAGHPLFNAFVAATIKD
jgi:CTP synthase